MVNAALSLCATRLFVHYNGYEESKEERGNHCDRRSGDTAALKGLQLLERGREKKSDGLAGWLHAQL